MELWGSVGAAVYCWVELGGCGIPAVTPLCGVVGLWSPAALLCECGSVEYCVHAVWSWGVEESCCTLLCELWGLSSPAVHCLCCAVGVCGVPAVHCCVECGRGGPAVYCCWSCGVCGVPADLLLELWGLKSPLAILLCGVARV